MAPGIMHILFVHSDGFVIKEFHFLLPSAERGEGGLGEFRDDSGQSSLHLQQKSDGEGQQDTDAGAHPCM